METPYNMIGIWRLLRFVKLYMSQAFSVYPLGFIRFSIEFRTSECCEKATGFL